MCHAHVINQSTAGSVVIPDCRIMHTLFEVVAYIANTAKLLSYKLPY